MRPQTLQERLMPCTQFEALERHWQARCDRGVDSDEETVRDKDEDDNEDHPQEEPAPLEARIRTTTIDMFKRVLLFSQVAAEVLYNNQMVTTLDVLWTWTPDLRAFRDPPQAFCVLGKAHVADFKRCRWLDRYDLW
jgi:hypothetical protein